MPSRESFEASKEEKSLVQKAKREANQEDILAAALGMRVGPQKPPATFWQPLKLFAYSQLTSLVRRATLKEVTSITEKVHNFKVSFISMKSSCFQLNVKGFVMYGQRAASCEGERIENRAVFSRATEPFQ